MLRETAKRVVRRAQMFFDMSPRAFCLVSGAPRSGTTAIIDWLGQQPGVSAFHESRVLIAAHALMRETGRFASLNRDKATLASLTRRLVRDYYASGRVLAGMTMIAEKEPLEPIALPSHDYAEFLDDVRELFPQFKLILAVRDPVATVWSMSQRTWGESLVNGQTTRYTIDEYTRVWCACAELAVQYCSSPSAYVVQYGRLVKEPASESTRLCHFLGLRNGVPFEPRRPKECGFRAEERELILRAAKPWLALLGERGISEL